MNLFNRKKPIYRRKRWIISLSVIAVLIAIRIILPTTIKIGLNNYLKDFSPSLRAHVADVDLAILRGVYTIEGITAEIKKKDKKFIEIGSAQAQLAWRDLFKGNLVAVVTVNELDFTYSNDVLPAVKEHMKSMKKDEKKEGPSVRIGRFDLKNSTVRTSLFPALTREQGVVLTKLEARVTNLTPTKDNPKTPFSMQGLLLGSGEVKTEGEANLLGETPEWTIDNEVKNFDLTSLNRFLKKNVPLTFTKGKLDLYAEAASRGDAIRGYVKPFVRNLDVMRTEENFVGAKHWLVEIVTALGNVVMKADQTTATRVPFVFVETFRPEGGQAISKAFEHGFQQELTRGVENIIGLEETQTKQAQEEN